jgi:hypothetical protein
MIAGLGYFAPVEGLPGGEFACTVELLAVELSGGNDKIKWMFG